MNLAQQGSVCTGELSTETQWVIKVQFRLMLATLKHTLVLDRWVFKKQQMGSYSENSKSVLQHFGDTE